MLRSNDKKAHGCTTPMVGAAGALKGGREKRKVISRGRKRGCRRLRRLRLRRPATGRRLLGEIESDVEKKGQRAGERE